MRRVGLYDIGSVPDTFPEGHLGPPENVIGLDDKGKIVLPNDAYEEFWSSLKQWYKPGTTDEEIFDTLDGTSPNGQILFHALPDADSLEG